MDISNSKETKENEKSSEDINIQKTYENLNSKNIANNEKNKNNKNNNDVEKVISNDENENLRNDLTESNNECIQIQLKNDEVYNANDKNNSKNKNEIDNSIKESYYKNKSDINNVNKENHSNEKDEVYNISKLCELKEISQLGENRKKVLTYFNELYAAKGQSITHSLIEIYYLCINDEIVLYMLQKYLHIHGLCVPCYKFGSNRNSCNLKIRCKWCHHYSHLNKNSCLHPFKMLHFKNKCKVCNHFIKGRFCNLLNECQFCHSIDHLPKNLKKKYHDILNHLYKKKEYSDIITKDLLLNLDEDKKNEKNLDAFDKDLMFTFENNNIDNNDNNKSFDTCIECYENNKKPCINYFLYDHVCLTDCNNCHNEIHKKKNSNLYILNYLHENNLCSVCPLINDNNCVCDNNSIYCHDSDHICYDIKVKNVLDKCLDSLKKEFSDTKDQGRSIENENKDEDKNENENSNSKKVDEKRKRTSHKGYNSIREKTWQKKNLNEYNKKYSYSRNESLNSLSLESNNIYKNNNDNFMSSADKNKNKLDDNYEIKEYYNEKEKNFNNKKEKKENFFNKHEDEKNFKINNKEEKNEKYKNDNKYYEDNNTKSKKEKNDKYSSVNLNSEKNFSSKHCSNTHSKSYYDNSTTYKLHNAKKKKKKKLDKLSGECYGNKSVKKSSHTSVNKEKGKDSKYRYKNLINRVKICNKEEIEEKKMNETSVINEKDVTLDKDKEKEKNFENISMESVPNNISLRDEKNNFLYEKNKEQNKFSNNEGYYSGSGSTNFEKNPCNAGEEKYFEKTLNTYTNYNIVDIHLNNKSDILLDDYDNEECVRDTEIKTNNKIKIINDVVRHEAPRPKNVMHNLLDDKYRKKKMMLGELTGFFTIEEHNKQKCIPCSFYFSNGCNYSIYCRNCHHESHRDHKGDQCHYKVLHKMKICKPCNDFFKGMCEHRKSKIPRKPHECAYCHEETHRKEVLKEINKKEKRSLSNFSKSDKIKKSNSERSMSNFSKICEFEINENKRSLSNYSRNRIISCEKEKDDKKVYKSELNSNKESTRDSQRNSKNCNIEDRSINRELKETNSSTNEKTKETNEIISEHNNDYISEDEMWLETRNVNNDKEKLKNKGKIDIENKEKKLNDDDNSKNEREIKKDEQEDFLKEESANEKKDLITRSYSNSLSSNEKEDKEENSNKLSSTNGFYENSTENISGKFTSDNIKNELNNLNDKSNEIKDIYKEMDEKDYEKEENVSPDRKENISKEKFDKTDKYHDKSIDKEDEEELDRLRAKRMQEIYKLQRKQGINLNDFSKNLSRHEKGACHPCVYYFVGFSGCLNGKNCLNCHHEDHRNPHSIFHPSRFLHIKKLCVPCSSYFKGECTRHMHTCVYCHYDSHKKEFEESSKTKKEINEKYKKEETDDYKEDKDNKKENTNDINEKEQKNIYDKNIENDNKEHKEEEEEEKIKNGEIKDEKKENKRETLEKTEINEGNKDVLDEKKKEFVYAKQTGYKERDAHERGVCHPCAFYFSGKNGCLKKNNCINCHDRDHEDINSPYHPSKLLHYKGICSPCQENMKGLCKRASFDCVHCHNEEHIPDNMKETVQKMKEKNIEKRNKKERKAYFDHKYKFLNKHKVNAYNNNNTSFNRRNFYNPIAYKNKKYSIKSISIDKKNNYKKVKKYSYFKNSSSYDNKKHITKNNNYEYSKKSHIKEKYNAYNLSINNIKNKQLSSRNYYSKKDKEKKMKEYKETRNSMNYEKSINTFNNFNKKATNKSNNNKFYRKSVDLNSIKSYDHHNETKFRDKLSSNNYAYYNSNKDNYDENKYKQGSVRNNYEDKNYNLKKNNKYENSKIKYEEEINYYNEQKNYNNEKNFEDKDNNNKKNYYESSGSYFDRKSHFDKKYDYRNNSDHKNKHYDKIYDYKKNYYNNDKYCEGKINYNDEKKNYYDEKKNYYDEKKNYYDEKKRYYEDKKNYYNDRNVYADRKDFCNYKKNYDKKASREEELVSPSIVRNNSNFSDKKELTKRKYDEVEMYKNDYNDSFNFSINNNKRRKEDFSENTLMKRNNERDYNKNITNENKNINKKSMRTKEICYDLDGNSSKKYVTKLDKGYNDNKINCEEHNYKRKGFPVLIKKKSNSKESFDSSNKIANGVRNIDNDKYSTYKRKYTDRYDDRYSGLSSTVAKHNSFLKKNRNDSIDLNKYKSPSILRDDNRISMFSSKNRRNSIEINNQKIINKNENNNTYEKYVDDKYNEHKNSQNKFKKNLNKYNTYEHNYRKTYFKYNNKDNSFYKTNDTTDYKTTVKHYFKDRNSKKYQGKYKNTWKNKRSNV
ncbi:conserved Plasmodium protein, unknown function [Plasmodium gallinaceum]|uniref:C3H1-type domain-containing protein n=1 Tax=Plasmodium gallinaceum TaxID=5849 RepID=A0A1J1GZV8_PLAGA|nr:conserved Plasmodium protein, unknown function [Plasmodium gallinaceum]CRG97824.1 conserved Plasmodium protein, unknown function [Plasmodium gallinaceum]